MNSLFYKMEYRNEEIKNSPAIAGLEVCLAYEKANKLNKMGDLTNEKGIIHFKGY